MAYCRLSAPRAANRPAQAEIDEIHLVMLLAPPHCKDDQQCRPSALRARREVSRSGPGEPARAAPMAAAEAMRIQAIEVALALAVHLQP